LATKYKKFTEYIKDILIKKLRKELEYLGIEILDEEWKQVKNIFKKELYLENEMIHYAGDIMDRVYYITDGVAKSYFIDINGKEFIWQIYFNKGNRERKNIVMDDSVSYYEKEGGFLAFEALEDVICYSVSWKSLEILFASDIKWQFLARMLTYNAYAISYKRVLSIMSENATQRFQRLLKENPSVFKNVKSYHIASYLGITPQSYSRLKKITIGE
jgi:CRP-like cAMP-binding protein